jgi:hypothetical protein
MWGLFVASRKATRIGRVELRAGLATAVLCVGLVTQAAAADGPAQPTPQVKVQSQAQYDTIAWGGLNWGLGVAANFDLGGTRVSSAQIVNGIVRLNDTSSNVDVSFVLEAHYFLKEALTKGCGLPLVLPHGHRRRLHGGGVGSFRRYRDRRWYHFVTSQQRADYWLCFGVDDRLASPKGRFVRQARYHELEFGSRAPHRSQSPSPGRRLCSKPAAAKW